MDRALLTIVFAAIAFVIATFVFLVLGIVEIFKGKRKFEGYGIRGFAGFLFSLLVMGGIAYCLYHVPDILMGGDTWEYLIVAGPGNAVNAALALAAALPMIYIYFLFITFFPKSDEKPYFSLAILSLVSGLGNSLIIFIINNALGRSNGYRSGLHLYMLTGIALFAISSVIVRSKLISFTNDYVLNKRIELSSKLLKTSFENFEGLDSGNIYAVLNNDTETISTFVNILISGLTALITIICCFFYIGFLNIYGLLLSVGIILFAAGSYYVASVSANKSWEQTRDIQNTFFKSITDMIDGFKELSLHRKKRNEFEQDMQDTCTRYRKTRVEGELRFVGVTVMGELLFTSVIGLVVFLFPIIFDNVHGDTLRDYTFIFLYMAGSVNVLLFAIPNILRVLISWKRVEALKNEIPAAESVRECTDEVAGAEAVLEISGLKYHYKGKDGEVFEVGPIECSFKTGEIVFITGGNGSGKSTLAKLFTGLYTPNAGEITINGVKQEPGDLGSYFSTIFSDFYLFGKLYGIDYQRKQAEIQKYLEMLRIDDKVQIVDGKFSTVKLSTGQRKRVALFLSYLEDRPFYLFDEWAAEQDPEFRSFFYKTLLPGFKARGKGVIAITHDDRYFSTADKVIKMEMGRIVRYEDRYGVKELDTVSV